MTTHASVSPSLAQEFDHRTELIFNVPAVAAAVGQSEVSISPDGLQSRRLVSKPPEYRDAAGIDDMLERTRDAITRYPRSVRARIGYGLALLTDGKVNDALDELEVALRIKPHDPAAMLHLSRALMVAGRFDEADLNLASLSRIMPGNLVVEMTLAELAIHRQDLPAAAAILRRSVKREPESPRANALLGVVLAGMQRLNEGIHHLRIATRLQVRSPGLQAALGMAYALANQPDRAVRALEAAQSLAPSMVEARHALAQVLLSGGHLQHAETILKGRLTQDPADRQAIERLAEVEYRRGKIRGALALLEDSLALSEEDEASGRARLLNNLAVCQWTIGRIDRARALFDQALASQPDSPVIHHNFVRLLYAEGHFDYAFKVLDRAQESFPGEPTTRILRDLCLVGQGSTDEAIDDLLRWTVDGEAPAAAWAGLGQLLTDAKGTPERAIPVLRAGVVRYPDDPAIANNLAYSLLMADRTDDARDVLRNAIKLHVEKPSVEHAVLSATIGLLALHEDRWDEARHGYLAAIEEAQALGNRSLEIAARQKMHLEFGRSLLQAGRARDALHEFRAGLATHGEGLYREHLLELVGTTERSLLLERPRHQP